MSLMAEIADEGGVKPMICSSTPAAERMRQYRRRRRLKRLVVSVELEPAEIEVFVKRGYLAPRDKENFGAHLGGGE